MLIAAINLIFTLKESRMADFLSLMRWALLVSLPLRYRNERSLRVVNAKLWRENPQQANFHIFNII